MQFQSTGQIDERSLIAVIRDIYLAQATGVLEVIQGDRKRRFFFKDGELFLPSSHFLGQRLGDLLELEKELELTPSQREQGAEDALRRAREEQTRQPDKSARARQQLQELVGRIVDVLVDWQSGYYQMTNTPLPSEPALVGPLPTAYLVMEGSVRDIDPDAALREIGGEDALVVADTSSRVLQQAYGIHPDEMFLLSRAETPTTVGELLRQQPHDQTDSLLTILRLCSVDLLRPARTNLPNRSEDPERKYTDSMVERFLLRFASQIPSQAISTTEEEQHRVRSLIQRFSGMDHYEVLDLAPDVEEAEIHRSFQSLAVVVHPENARRLGLANGRGALRLLFEKVTVAYLTLSDPERRARYNVEAGIEVSRGHGSGPRSGEQQEVAQATYRRAKRMFETGELHFALELARQAIRADPQPESVALLARIQRKNPNWLDQSVGNFKQAIRMDPKNPQYRLELAQLMEEKGLPERARIHYQAALQLSPGLGEAMDGLARVQSEVGSAEEQSFLGKIRGIWSDEDSKMN